MKVTLGDLPDDFWGSIATCILTLSPLELHHSGWADPDCHERPFERAEKLVSLLSDDRIKLIENNPQLKAMLYVCKAHFLQNYKGDVDTQKPNINSSNQDVRAQARKDLANAYYKQAITEMLGGDIVKPLDDETIIPLANLCVRLFDQNARVKDVEKYSAELNRSLTGKGKELFTKIHDALDQKLKEKLNEGRAWRINE